MAKQESSSNQDIVLVEEQAGTARVEAYVDPVAERALLRKLDLWIVPPSMLIYLLSFLDRVNIGNARLYGLEEDLGLKGNQYQIAVSILFVTYILSEVPSNLVLKKFTPSRWLAFCTLSWGIIATLTGITQNFAGLVVCRLLLGLVEGGLFPGLTIYLFMFYTKKEYALRIGYLLVAAALAGSVGGLLAYAIGHLDGHRGMRGWRWILILEGLPSIIAGIAVWFWLADSPETAHYLSEQERELIKTRLRRQIGHTKDAEGLHRKDVVSGFKDWKVWLFCIAPFCADIVLYGYSTFLPTIIKGLGEWSTAQVQALTIPCYALGSITYLTVAFLSDRYQRRAVFTVPFGIVCTSGYAILVSPASAGVKYFGCLLVGMSYYVVIGLPLAWLPSNTPRYGKRIVASGMQLAIANSAGVASPFLYQNNEGPRYIKGHSVSMGMMTLTSIIYTSLALYLRHLNKRKKAGLEDWRTEGLTEEEIQELGEDNPRFLYHY